jgi:hypothetical protein
MGWPLQASIECTDRMLVFMSPVSLVAAVNRCLALPPLLQCLARERDWVRTRGSISRRAVDYVGSPFSQEQLPFSTLLTTTWNVTICGPREIHMVEGHMRTEREKCVVCCSGFSLHGVHQFESPRLSDMSTACLWQSSHRWLNIMDHGLI